MVNILNRVRQPFNVNTLAQKAAAAALDDTAHLKETVRITEGGRRSLQARLGEMGLSYTPSVTNFILVDVGVEGRAVAHALLRKGIIVRSMEVYGLPTHIRVTIGTPQENARALKSLGDVLDEVEAAVRSSDSTGGRSDQ